MLNWFRPVCVVNYWVSYDEELGNVKHLSITPDFARKHRNYVYFIKTKYCTPTPLFFQFGDTITEEYTYPAVFTVDYDGVYKLGDLNDDGILEEDK